MSYWVPTMVNDDKIRVVMPVRTPLVRDGDDKPVDGDLFADLATARGEVDLILKFSDRAGYLGVKASDLVVRPWTESADGTPPKKKAALRRPPTVGSPKFAAYDTAVEACRAAWRDYLKCIFATDNGTSIGQGIRWSDEQRIKRQVEEALRNTLNHLNKDRAESLLQGAGLCALLDDTKGTVERLKAAAARDERLQSVYQFHLAIETQKTDPETGYKLISRAVELDAKNARALFWRSRLATYVGQDGKEDRARALKLDPLVKSDRMTLPWSRVEVYGLGKEIESLVRVVEDGMPRYATLPGDE